MVAALALAGALDYSQFLSEYSRSADQFQIGAQEARFHDALGALPAGGAPVSEPLTFTAGGVCGGTITATLQLQDGPASLGSAAFTFQLGRFIPAVLLTQDFDGVTPPALPAGWATLAEGGQAATGSSFK